MKHPPQEIEEGELLAYLEGKRPLHVKRALRHSPELRERLRQLQQNHEHLERLFGDAKPRMCPRWRCASQVGRPPEDSI